MLTEKKVALTLSNAGIPSTVTGELDDQVDGEVSVTGTQIHVQVGEDYLIVCRHSPDGEDYWVQHIKHTTLKNLVSEVSSLLSTTV